MIGTRLVLALSLAGAGIGASSGCGPAAPSRGGGAATGESSPGGRSRRAPAQPDDPAAADAVAAAVRAHEILTSVSAVPVDSALVARAALDAVAAGLLAEARHPAFGGDPERDRALLASEARALVARAVRPAPAELASEVASAVARAAGDPHVFALDGDRVGGLLASISGQPFANLGFAMHAAPDGAGAAGPAPADQPAGRWVVSEVDRGGPAASAGLLHGDLVQSIDGQPPSPGGLLDLGRSLREGQAVRLTGSRQGAAGPLSIELVAVRTRPPIIEHKLLPGKVGYLRLHYLPHSEDPTADAAAQLSGALGELDRARVSRLVIDLRDSTGGAPFDVASILVRGDPLLRIQPPGEPVLPVERTRPAWKVRRKTAVLVNDQSYAAAEMIALALTDHGEARSFGQPTGGALSLPGQAELPGGVLLFYPQALVAGARTAPPAARRVEPDERVANTGPDDYRAGRDPQLAAALAWLKRR